MSHQYFVGILVAAALLAGCRGAPSEDPPIHPIRNMYHQPRYNVQAAGEFFQDGRAMRPIPAGTVAREEYVDPEIATGWSDTERTWVLTVPAAVVDEHGGYEPMLARGQERYDIYCSPCHGLSGAGDGMVPARAGGPIKPPTLHDDRLRHAPDGQIFATITNGVRNMPPYEHAIPVDDRWAIVSYVRALQISQGQEMEASR